MIHHIVCFIFMQMMHSSIFLMAALKDGFQETVLCLVLKVKGLTKLLHIIVDTLHSP